MIRINLTPKASIPALSLMVCVALTGCTQTPPVASSGSTAAVQCPVTSDASFSGTLRLGYQQIPNADLIVKDKDLLEACLPKAVIKWSQFSSGADVIQAFGSNSIDLGLMGSSPATKAVSAPLNLPVQIIWIHDIIGTAESLVTRDKGVTNIQQLKGRTIAVPFGSTSHFSLLFALQQAGLSDSDVKLINVEPENMLAAWQGGQIDAAWVWDPVLSKLKDASGTLITSSAETAKAGALTADMEIASSSFIQGNSNVIRVWTGVENYAVGLIHSDPSSAATSIAAELGTTPSEVKTQFAGYDYPIASDQEKLFSEQIPNVLKSTASFLQSQGTVKKVGADYSSSIYTAGIKSVASAS